MTRKRNPFIAINESGVDEESQKFCPTKLCCYGWRKDEVVTEREELERKLSRFFRVYCTFEWESGCCCDDGVSVRQSETRDTWCKTRDDIRSSLSETLLLTSIPHSLYFGVKATARDTQLLRFTFKTRGRHTRDYTRDDLDFERRDEKDRQTFNRETNSTRLSRTDRTEFCKWVEGEQGWRGCRMKKMQNEGDAGWKRCMKASPQQQRCPSSSFLIWLHSSLRDPLSFY